MINVSLQVHLCRKWDVLMRVGELQKTLFMFFFPSLGCKQTMKLGTSLMVG